jgi:hypothetical protein
MRKTIFTTTVAALILGSASCSVEQGIDNGKIVEGEPTYMSISFTTPSKATTKADDNATTEESKFTSVDVFIFNPMGVQVKHARLSASDFDTPPTEGPYSDTYTMKSTAKIATTTGTKTVIVGVNLSINLSNALSGVMEGNFSRIAQSVAILDVTNEDEGFVMFSVRPEDINLVQNPQGEQNYAKIKVQRLVAKVSVQRANSVTIGGDGHIDLGNLQFTLNNTNKKTFYVQPADFKDHNWAGPALPTDLEDGRTDFVSVDVYNTGVLNLVPKYALENTSELHRMGEITRVSVRGTFVPKQTKEWNSGGGIWEDKDHETNVSPQTFWLVVCDNGAIRAYFFNEMDAYKYLAENNTTGNGKIMEYTDGYCYWDIFLNPDNDYDVFRNDFYRCHITKIVGPGRPTPEVTDPTIPPSRPTDLIVDIEMLYWNVVLINDVELEPY